MSHTSEVAQGRTLIRGTCTMMLAAVLCTQVLALPVAAAIAEDGQRSSIGRMDPQGRTSTPSPAHTASAVSHTYYVCTTGSDGYPGTRVQPFMTLHKAMGVAVGGDAVFVRGGPKDPYIPIARVGTATQAADTRYLRKGLLDVTLLGADPTGRIDSTQAIQRAVDTARDYQLAAFFPNQANGERGVYQVTRTLRCIEREKTYFDYGRMKPNVLIGSTHGRGRPVIRLAEKTDLFSDPAHPVPLVWFWATPGPWETRHDSEDPRDGEDDVSFDQVFKGIDIDLGGNPGAIGIRHAGAQGSAIEDVRIMATGAYAGLGKFGVLGCAVYNVEVEGGRYAVSATPEGDRVSPYNGHGDMIGCTFRNQTTAVFELSLTAAPVLLAGFHIVCGPGTVLNRGNVCLGRGGISLIDGILEMADGQIFVARDRGDDFHVRTLRNVYVRGVSAVAPGRPIADTMHWTLIQEYAYCADFGRALMDGALSPGGPFERESKIENVAATDELLGNLIRKHRWDEATFPSFEDSDAFDVKEAGGARGDGVTDDTDALEAAINSHRKIFLSKGIYLIRHTLTLKSNRQLFGLGTTFSQIRPVSSWQPERGKESILLTTEDDPIARTVLAFLSVSNHLYRETPGRGGFTPIQWRAGRASMTRNVMAGVFAERWQETGNLNYHRVRINGSGGGRHFGLLGRWEGANHDNNRSLLIENTVEPLHLYAFNGAADPANIGIEVLNSRNVHLYYPTHEGSSTSLRIDHSQTVRVFTEYGNNETGVGRGGVEVFDSNDVLIADSVHSHDARQEADQPALMERFGGVSRTIPDDASIVLYKRSVSDGTPLIPAGTTAKKEMKP